MKPREGQPKADAIPNRERRTRMDTMMIVDPAIEGVVRSDALASRLRTLAGTRIGLVDNSKHRSDVFLDRIEQLLVAEYGVAQFSRYRKTNASVPMPPDVLVAMTAECDAVIHGIAD
jgi:hypothetical protein